MGGGAYTDFFQITHTHLGNPFSHSAFQRLLYVHSLPHQYTALRSLSLTLHLLDFISELATCFIQQIVKFAIFIDVISKM